MNTVIGHDGVKQFFVGAKANNRIAHCYLLHGKEGIGKKLLALETGRMLRCLNSSGYDSCTCANCVRHQDGSGVGFQNTLVRQEDLNMELVSNGLNRHAQMAVAHGKNSWNTIVIENIHLANKETANALLKTLEEPGERTIIILTTSNIDLVLPTIVSRSTLVAMKPLAKGEIERIYHRLDNLDNTDNLDNDEECEEHDSNMQKQLRQELYDGTMNSQKINGEIYFAASKIVDKTFADPAKGTMQMLELLWKLDDKALFHDICVATYKKTLDKYYENVENISIIMFADHILSLLSRCEYNINLETVKLDFLSKLSALATEISAQKT